MRIGMKRRDLCLRLYQTCLMANCTRWRDTLMKSVRRGRGRIGVDSRPLSLTHPRYPCSGRIGNPLRPQHDTDLPRLR
jgi:hypothetical protein